MFLAAKPSLQLRIGGFQWFPPVPFPRVLRCGWNPVDLVWWQADPTICLSWRVSMTFLTQREAVFHWSHCLCTSGRILSTFLFWTKHLRWSWGLDPLSNTETLLPPPCSPLVRAFLPGWVLALASVTRHESLYLLSGSSFSWWGVSPLASFVKQRVYSCGLF